MGLPVAFTSTIPICYQPLLLYSMIYDYRELIIGQAERRRLRAYTGKHIPYVFYYDTEGFIVGRYDKDWVPI